MSSSTPSIRISQHSRYASSPGSYTVPPGAASPMGIPGAQDSVPPPLPPPTNLPELSSGRDPGWQWGNDPNSTDFGRPASVRAGSSLLGGSGFRSPRQEQEEKHTGYNGMNDARRGSSISTITGARDHEMSDDHQTPSDEDGSASRPGSNYRLQSERRLEQTTLSGSSQAYDKQLLSRIGGPNTPDSKRGSLSHASNAQDAHAAHLDSRRNSQLRPLAMPSHERRQSSIASISSIDSPMNSRWHPNMSGSGAISPGYTGFFERSPVDGGRLHSRTNSIAFEESASHRGSYDNSIFTNDEYGMEESQMGGLRIHDRSPSGSDDYATGAKTGDKRRASSPPKDFHLPERASVSSASGQNSLFDRRSVQQAPRSPVSASRLHAPHGSISSASSYGPRHGSLGSSLGVASIPSSATSYGSGRVSPLGLSPGSLDPDLRGGTHYGAGRPLSRSPIISHAQHQRNVSGGVPGGAQQSPGGSTSLSRQNSLNQFQGLWICECCPKKPRKFDTEDELRHHESEKQYTCAYCNNRFKNKNEAERHQNSLHLRKHSWSCAALAGPEAAFHSSLSASGTDSCGYCGEDFPNPPQWDVRAEHLNQVHKFGECNKAKKFFRADHFRQHLKHSHAGTSGKWTNMLENACMKDEPLPEKRPTATTSSGATGQAPPALMVTTTGLSGPSLSDSGVVSEHSRGS